jgi:hypothetical protein
MYEYQLAVTFWSAVVIVALVSPFVVAFLTRAIAALAETFDPSSHDEHTLASIPSNPRPSSRF